MSCFALHGSVFFSLSGNLRDLHVLPTSFPTRRSAYLGKDVRAPHAPADRRRSIRDVGIERRLGWLYQPSLRPCSFAFDRAAAGAAATMAPLAFLLAFQ